MDGLARTARQLAGGGKVSRSPFAYWAASAKVERRRAHVAMSSIAGRLSKLLLQ